MPGFSFPLYALSSCVLTSSVIVNAYITKHQFYATVVHLFKSKFSLLVLFNFAFVLFFFFAKVTRRIFLGQLRAAELETLWENTGYAITETCLALTIFRDELNLNTYLLFSCLLFFKAFHWLCKARVEHMEQDEERYKNFLSQFRMTAFITVLLLSDAFSVLLSVSIVSENGASVQILFGFEFLLLLISVVAIMIKYTLVTMDTFLIPGRWYNKSLYEMYSKLAVAFIHFAVYAAFFCIIFTFYGIPIHLMRSLYISFHNVAQRLKHFLQFRRVTANLNSTFANATEEDLEATDKVCVICREEMALQEDNDSPETKIKKLPCGHIFHFHCLRSWFERQLKCPTCRADVVGLSPGIGRNNEANRVVPNNEQRPVQQDITEQDASREDAEEAEEANPFERETLDDNTDPQISTERLERINATVRRNLERIERNYQHEFVPEINLEDPNTFGFSGTEQNNSDDVDSLGQHRDYLTVNQYLENQIEFISLQLQIYSAQVAAANAAHEAAQSLLQSRSEQTVIKPEHEHANNET